MLDQVFPEYETAFTNTFGDTSLAVLQTCPTPKELAGMDLDTLCQLIEAPSRKRFSMAKALELKELARSSFGFEMAGDVFSTMIRLYAGHIIFLTEQIKEMDRKIAAIMDELNTPITTIAGIGQMLGRIFSVKSVTSASFSPPPSWRPMPGSILLCGNPVSTTAFVIECPNGVHPTCGTRFGWRHQWLCCTIRRCGNSSRKSGRKENLI